MEAVNIGKAYHDGLISLGFRQHVSTDEAQKLVVSLGLVTQGGFMKCGRGPIATIVKVETGSGA